MGYSIDITTDASAIIAKTKKRDQAKSKKIARTLALLAEPGPDYPSLRTHRYENFDKRFGAPIWQSNIETGTPSAWRIWWFHGPKDGTITIVDLGPHP